MHGLLNGMAEYRLKGRGHYRGSMVNGMEEGQGSRENDDGSVYTGEWR